MQGPTLIIWLLAVVMMATPSTLQGQLDVRLANGSDREAQTRDQLLGLVDTYDVSDWLYTSEVLIDQESIPHSHPVLTLHTRHLGNDLVLLSTFVHEQFHWLEDGETLASFREAMAAFEALFPSVPDRANGGARDTESTYRHLIVCDLELQAMTKLVGAERAREVLGRITHYEWIYEQVLHDSRVREVNTQHGFVVGRPSSALLAGVGRGESTGASPPARPPAPWPTPRPGAPLSERAGGPFACVEGSVVGKLDSDALVLDRSKARIAVADVPIIDISPLRSGSSSLEDVASAIGIACRQHGFFYVVGHGISSELETRLEEASHAFFEQDLDTKLQIRMELAGTAWRGYFPVGDELTSGKPDQKEGLYFGAELDELDPRVQAGTPLHGPNLFPAGIPELRETVLDYMEAQTDLGHSLMQGIALSLGLEAGYFRNRFMADPLTLFRIFHYPPVEPLPEAEEKWGVGEHTDYGVLTILKQDDIGGLQVKTQSRWIDAPPVPGSFVCNIGDMLDRLTGGLYRSTPHRVLNTSRQGRLSFPFFFDPGFHTRIEPIDLGDAAVPADDRDQRWDQASVHDFEGTYGDYVLGKVSKVFPELGGDGI